MEFGQDYDSPYNWDENFFVCGAEFIINVAECACLGSCLLLRWNWRPYLMFIMWYIPTPAHAPASASDTAALPYSISTDLQNRL